MNISNLRTSVSTQLLQRGVKKSPLFDEYIILAKEEMLDGTFLLKLVPATSSRVFPFVAGQYVRLRNPQYDKPNEEHCFSIASDPSTTGYLELCIKVFGYWTQALAKLRMGDRLYVRGPLGEFTWPEGIQNGVFLVGGVGISPILSILRSLAYQKSEAKLTLLYGNRTPETVMYAKELEKLARQLPLKVVHIFSHLEPNHPWSGYRGFITPEILKKEVDLRTKPTFFTCGPPIFVDKMKAMISDLSIPTWRIKEELLIT